MAIYHFIVFNLFIRNFGRHTTRTVVLD